MEESWDKKKIAIAIVLLFLLVGSAYAAKKYILPSLEEQFVEKTKVTKGVVEGAQTTNQEEDTKKDSTSKPPLSFSSSLIQETVQEKFAAIKNQVSNLSVDEVASASPQVKKILNDFKALQDYPKNQAKEFCENMCRSF